MTNTTATAWETIGSIVGVGTDYSLQRDEQTMNVLRVIITSGGRGYSELRRVETTDARYVDDMRALMLWMTNEAVTEIAAEMRF